MPPRPQRTNSDRRGQGPWKHGKVPVFGLVGRIGAGKSTVAARMAEIGAFVIDADAVGHALLGQRPVRDEVIAHFGPAVVAPKEAEGDDPAIDRGALASIVFAKARALRDLESILHPAMTRTFEKAIARTLRRGGVKAIVLDAAILFEAGWDSLCDRFVFVDAARPVRLERVGESRGWDDATLAAREAAQWSADEKRARADVVLVNDGDLAALRSAVGACWNDLLRAPKNPWSAAPPSAGLDGDVEVDGGPPGAGAAAPGLHRAQDVPAGGRGRPD